MIQAIVQDISSIIDNRQKKYSFDAIVYHLDADVKYYLYTAFLNDHIVDFDVTISKGPSLIHLKVRVRENLMADWDDLGFAISQENITNANLDDDYNRAMRGI